MKKGIFGVIVFGALASGTLTEARSIDSIPGISLSPIVATIFEALSVSDWKVGDTLHFNMRVKPIPMTIDNTLTITQMEKSEVTIDEVITLTKTIKETIETVINKDTGEILHTRINGKEMKTPKTGGAPKIINEEEAHIKVAAGEFDCVHMVTGDDQGNTSETWLNPSVIPITGMLKMVTVQQLLTIEMELRSFDRGH